MNFRGTYALSQFHAHVLQYIEAILCTGIHVALEEVIISSFEPFSTLLWFQHLHPLILLITMSPANKRSTHQKILNATASYAARGIAKAPRKKVAALCGFSAETKSYVNSLGLLKNKKKYIVFDKETITITELGLVHAEPIAQAKSNQELLDTAKEKVKGKGKLVLDVLFDGKTHSRVAVGEAIDADPTKKSFMNIFGPLKKLEFIEYVKDEAGEPGFRMTDCLFEIEGRPGSDKVEGE